MLQSELFLSGAARWRVYTGKLRLTDDRRLRLEMSKWQVAAEQGRLLNCIDYIIEYFIVTVKLLGSIPTVDTYPIVCGKDTQLENTKHLLSNMRICCFPFTQR